jgi:hypothetical protein
MTNNVDDMCARAIILVRQRANRDSRGVGRADLVVIELGQSPGRQLSFGNRSTDKIVDVHIWIVSSMGWFVNKNVGGEKKGVENEAGTIMSCCMGTIS